MPILVILIISLICSMILIDSVYVYRSFDLLVILFVKYIKPFLTWRILIIYIPIWFIISGWSMVGIAIGHGWFRKISVSWQTFLWTPICPEKFFTIPLTIYLHKKIFPNHSVQSLQNVLNTEKEKNKTNKIILFFKKVFKK